MNNQVKNHKYQVTEQISSMITKESQIVFSEEAYWEMRNKQEKKVQYLDSSDSSSEES